MSFIPFPVWQRLRNDDLQLTALLISGETGGINLHATAMRAGKNNDVPLCEILIPTHFPRQTGLNGIKC